MAAVSRERAEREATKAADDFLNEYGLPEVYDAGHMLKKTSEHFLKHADRAHNEAIEAAAKGEEEHADLVEKHAAQERADGNYAEFLRGMARALRNRAATIRALKR